MGLGRLDEDMSFQYSLSTILTKASIWVKSWYKSESPRGSVENDHQAHPDSDLAHLDVT